MELVVVAHCLLNPSVRVQGLAGKKPGIKGNVIQLPCPESVYFGKRRWEVSKEQLEIPMYRRFCRELFQPVADILEQHKDCEITFIGVAKSPSCAALTTTIGYRGGIIEKAHEAKHEHIAGMGVFFEEIEKELEKRGIRVRYQDA
jgi:predicted secreted protein